MFAEKYNKIIKEIFTQIIKMAIITMGNIQGTSITVSNESLSSIITWGKSLGFTMWSGRILTSLYTSRPSIMAAGSFSKVLDAW